MFKKILQLIPKRVQDPTRNPSCAVFEVDNWSISDFIVKKLISKVGVHPFPLSELSLMVSALAYFKPTHLFEWGTNIGKSARVFYEAAKHYRIVTQIHSIDLPDDIEHVEHPGGHRGKLVRGLQGVTLHLGDGLQTSLTLLKEINGVARPLFFLDGDHSYSSVKRELEAIIKQVPGAIILVHDTFYQSADAQYNIGPYRAIADTMDVYGKAYRQIVLNTGLPGMTLIYPKSHMHDHGVDEL